MKKSLTKEILGHLVICCSKLAVSALFIPYGQSLGRSLGELERIAANCPHDFSRHSPGTVSVTLNRMKTRGLVTLSGSKKKAIWRITQDGKSHFKDVGSGITLPAEDGKSRIAMFDIPEDRKTERDWLRAELLSFDYTPLQKSVFIGTRPLPKKLLKELDERGLRPYIRVVGLE